MQRMIGYVLVSGLILAGACEQKHEAAPASPTPSEAAQATQAAPPPQAANTNDPASEAKALFAQRCTMCHGAGGQGDGVAAANLNPKPRNYTDAAWQASVKDEELSKAIVEGGTAVGKSMMMPPNPDLKDKPKVVDELVKIVRSFKK